jgi:hypothetical protein
MEESSDANGSDMEDRAVLPLPTTDNIRPSGLAPTAGTRARVRQLPYRAEIQQIRPKKNDMHMILLFDA